MTIVKGLIFYVEDEKKRIGKQKTFEMLTAILKVFDGFLLSQPSLVL